MGMNFKPLAGALCAALLAGTAGCAATGSSLPLGGNYQDLDSPKLTQYCRPGSAIVWETAHKSLISPARSYEGGTCK